MSVFVLDRRKKPLMPCSEKRARLLLERGRARVTRCYPFTIRLIDRTVEQSARQPVRIKIDPGSRTTGSANVREDNGETVVLALAELTHRGGRIRDRLRARRAFRHRRRSRPRYRSQRFDNRRRPAGWLAPSLRHRPDTVLSWVGRLCCHAPAAAANATRWMLFNALKGIGLPIETGSGGRTKWNRARFDVPNAHATDAACVGEVQALTAWRRPILSIEATGRGAYQRTRLDRFGFPRGHLIRAKRIAGFQTGDMVRAVIRSGKKAGIYVGRAAIRASKKFNLQTADGVVQGIHAKHCELLALGDGYGYALTRELLPSPGLKPGLSRSLI